MMRYISELVGVSHGHDDFMQLIWSIISTSPFFQLISFILPISSFSIWFRNGVFFFCGIPFSQHSFDGLQMSVSISGECIDWHSFWSNFINRSTRLSSHSLQNFFSGQFLMNASSWASYFMREIKQYNIWPGAILWLIHLEK